MSSGVRPASLIALAMQPIIGLPSGLERVRWKASVISPQPSSTPRILAPRALAHDLASLIALAMQPIIGLPSGLERVRWKASVISPQPSSTPRILAPRALADS